MPRGAYINPLQRPSLHRERQVREDRSYIDPLVFPGDPGEPVEMAGTWPRRDWAGAGSGPTWHRPSRVEPTPEDMQWVDRAFGEGWQGTPRDWTTQVQPFHAEHMSAERGDIPFCSQCGRDFEEGQRVVEMERVHPEHGTYRTYHMCTNCAENAPAKLRAVSVSQPTPTGEMRHANYEGHMLGHYPEPVAAETSMPRRTSGRLPGASRSHGEDSGPWTGHHDVHESSSYCNPLVSR